MFSKILLILFFVTNAFASYEGAEKHYGGGTISLAGYRRTVVELVNGGFYFSAIPWLKDYMVKSNAALDGELEAALDKMIAYSGVKIFESLPEEILKRSRSANIKYILAKRLFKTDRGQDALRELQGIDEDHAIYPFVLHLRGTINAQLNNHKEAESNFRDCIKQSGNSTSQMRTNRDYCVAGIARVQFAQHEYKKADLTYLDIPKDSFVWPEILFEEAWNSYYEKNFNRTLGKLVSYRAPVFDFVFKPETEVLKALTYLKMCLYDDAKKTTDEFYNDFMAPARELRTKLLGMGKNYREYYELMANHDARQGSNSGLVESILKSIKKDAAFIEMKTALSLAVSEYNNLRKQNKTPMRHNLLKNMQTVLDEYRSIIGAYTRAGMVSKYAELYSAFQGMSFIKLEVLAQRKERLYQADSPAQGKRGDVRYIDRNDKQYFWTFNGEFWADELGDYVFALRSEC